MIDLAIVVPFYNHEHAIERTIAGIRRFGLKTWLIDDGSSPRCRAVLERIANAEASWLQLRHLPTNRGKGVAVREGMEAARAAGCTHVLQIDADGQHECADIPRMIELAQERPEAIITGVPIFDHTAPKSRLYGRRLTRLWVCINTLSGEVRDAMCGFRIYPLAATLALTQRSQACQRMEFDPEILVRASWAGIPIVSMPTRVTYPSDGVSHFNMLRDNTRISAMHARLFLGMLLRAPRLLARRLGGLA
jgi:glycosyltransferase involved in cell wall biosynthesis